MCDFASVHRAATAAVSTVLADAELYNLPIHERNRLTSKLAHAEFGSLAQGP